MQKILILLLFFPTLFAAFIKYSVHDYDIHKLVNQYPKFDASRTLSSWSKSKPKTWLDRSQIPPNLLLPILVNEDTQFYFHDGVNFKEIYNALRDSVFSGVKLRGASTISMQLARNLFLTKKRSITRKIKEILLARKLECILGKEKILEVYFNIIEFAPEVYGLKNAMKYYFNKDHDDNWKIYEGSILAQALPNPKLYGRKHISLIIKKRIEKVAKKLKRDAYINLDELNLILNSKL